jgi:IS30 family transposase
METDLDVFFCDPTQPLAARHHLTPTDTASVLSERRDLSAHSADDLAAVAAGLNGRPRKTLGWKTPAEAMAALLSGQAKDGVASTG